MQNLFNDILKMSVSAVPVIVVVLCLRQLFKRYPKSYSFALWLLVFASLAIPFKIPVNIELPTEKTTVEITQTIVQELGAQAQKSDITTSPVTEIQQNETQQAPVVPQQIQQNITQNTHTNGMHKLFTLQLWHIWLCGLLFLAAFEIVNLKGIYDKTRFAFRKQDNIYYCDQTAMPFVYGIIKPKIILPSDISPLTEQFVIRHEQSHINRRDYIIKPLCFVIAIVHWFNPLVWLSFALMVKDMELSCDEKVVKTFNIAGKQEYCEALLNFAVKDKPYKINAVLFGEGNCGLRIKNVLDFKRPQKVIAIVLAVCVALVAIAAFTTGKQEEQFDFEGWSFAQLEEHIPYSDEERFAAVNRMNNIPESEIEAYFTEVVEKYCAGSDLAKLSGLTVTRDNLTMVYNTHRKALANCTLSVNLELLPCDTLDYQLDAQKAEQAKQFCSDLWAYLDKNYDFIKHSVNIWEIKAVTESGRVVWNPQSNAVNDFDSDSESIWYKEKRYVDQPEEELSAQKVAFKYGDSSGGSFALKKFGIAQDNQLYIEYRIVGDDYFLDGDGTVDEKIAAKAASLNDVYADIGQKVIHHKDVQQYVTANSLKTAVVAFEHRFLENGVLEFPLILEEKAFVPDYDVRLEDGIETGGQIKDLWTKENDPVDIMWFKDATFVGDSVAEGLRIYTTIANSVGDIASFVSAKNLSPADIVSGTIDSFEHLAEQSGTEAIDATNPEKIYITLGTNALVEMPGKEFLKEYNELLETLKEKFPQAQIYVCSVPPVTKGFAESRDLAAFKPENLELINEQLAHMANDNGAYYLNLHEVLADEDGNLKDEYAYSDGMHLKPDVYTKWIEYLMTHTVDESDNDLCGYPKQEYFENKTETVSEDVTETETEQEPWNDEYPISLPMLEAGKYVFPIDMTNEAVRINRGYTGQYPKHDGIDIAAPYGTEIFASADGKVIKSEESTVGDGNHVVIEHANGYYTLYGHCSKLLVKEGDEVKQGDLIAKIGSTGNSTGNHLHFEFGFGYDSEPNGGLSLDPYNAVGTRCLEDLNSVSINEGYQQSSDDNSDIQKNVDEEQYYIAQAGDSPISIAKAHKLNVDELYAMNPDIKENGVFVGDKVRVTQPIFGWPIGEGPTGEGVRISRGFVGQYPDYNGVAIAGPKGTDIVASADGRVIKAYMRTDNYGNYIVIQHTGGYRTLYAHCSELLVKMGDYVNKGDVIAKMGSTGNATGNQLHFEIILENDTRIDPYTKW